MSQTARDIIRTSASLIAYGIISCAVIGGVYIIGLGVVFLGDAIQ